MTTRILDVVDMQGDFVQKSGKLFVPNSDVLIARTNDFFNEITHDYFDAVLFKYDTHFADEYQHSPESALFPLHCEYSTPGWELAIEPGLLDARIPAFYMGKNTFDMWDRNPLPRTQDLNFKCIHENRAYHNLHKITRDPNIIQRGVLRDSFMSTLSPQGLAGVEVTMIGVASNFCDHDAMAGYLSAGASVKVVEDLVAGLPTTVPGRAASGDIHDVIALPCFQPYVANGQLTLTTADKVLKGMQP